MNNIYLITTDDKKFDNWSKRIKNKLNKNKPALEHFNIAYNDIARGNYLARASFVCYWEIYTYGNLAKLAPAMTQATLIHMLHRFLEQQRFDEVNVVQQIMNNFLRLLQVLDSPQTKGESDEQE